MSLLNDTLGGINAKQRKKAKINETSLFSESQSLQLKGTSKLRADTTTT